MDLSSLASIWQYTPPLILVMTPKVVDAVRTGPAPKLDIVGIYPNYAEAQKAWKAAAQRTVDNAHMRYFVVHMHRLMDPDHGH